MKIVEMVLSVLFLFALAGCAKEETWQTIPEVPPLPKADEASYAPVNGIRMYYEVWNREGADPVLLLHGGIGGNYQWGFQLPELIKKHKVIAAESRGNARSTSSEQPLSYELMASDYAALLDYLKIDKASVVGWSDGAIIGIEMALHSPEKLNRLFAFGANYNVLGMKPGYDKDPVFSRLIEEQIARSRKLSSSPEQFDAVLKQRLDMWNNQPDMKGEELARIRTPTAVVDGDHEEAITPGHPQELARLIPGSKLIMLPNVSHIGLWQDPASFNKAMTEFLDGK
jgi:pimeloyl-ACP methyl ester carboxylesterase